jgi:hypothetical protein
MEPVAFGGCRQALVEVRPIDDVAYVMLQSTPVILAEARIQTTSAACAVL